ncbi:MAG: lasso peptide biosynthesis B2 protein [Parasphingorhabdus sp.]|uniref:lasso peptide biosynthesis B2 protein n=1 Tax=Parasphingorhabdus sp. TaxID=2709688 RepID=UPI003002E98B
MKVIWRDKWLIVLAFTLLWVIRVGLWTIGYRRLHSLVATKQTMRLPSDAMAQRVAFSVFFSSRMVPKATCLVQAISAQWIFNLRGYSSHIQVGVKENERLKLEAHAWLLCGNRVIIGGNRESLADYSPFLKLPQR